MAWGVFFGMLSGPVNGGPTTRPFFVCCVVSSPMQWCLFTTTQGKGRSQNMAKGSRERLVDRSLRRARVVIARLMPGKKSSAPKAARGAESQGRGGGTQSHTHGRLNVTPREIIWAGDMKTGNGRVIPTRRAGVESAREHASAGTL